MTNRSTLLLLMIMVVFSPLAIDIYLPALPLMAQDFSVDITYMQWSISVFILCLGFGQLLSGPLSDRFGRRPIALGGVVIYGISSFLLASVNNIEAFIIFRMTQGLGACAIVVAAFASVRDRYDPIKSGVMYSYLSSIICCVPAIAPLLGSILTEQLGWRSNFYIMGIYAVFAGLAVFLALPETRPHTTVQHAKLITIKRFKPILAHPVFLFNALIIMLTMAIILTFVTSSPAWIMVHLQQSQQTFVFWFSLNAILNIVAYVIAPKILIKLGVKNTIGSGMIIVLFAGMLMLALIQWNHPAGFMLPVMLSSIGISLLIGTCSGQALSPFGDNAGSASALLGFIQMSGASILVFLLQLLPLSIPQQFALLVAAFVPVYVFWKLPKVKDTLYKLTVEQA